MDIKTVEFVITNVEVPDAGVIVDEAAAAHACEAAAVAIKAAITVTITSVAAELATIACKKVHRCLGDCHMGRGAEL